MDKWTNCNRTKEDCNFAIYFPASSHLVYFLQLCGKKITMIALEWCNPYYIKAYVNTFWNQKAQELKREKRYRLIRAL